MNTNIIRKCEKIKIANTGKEDSGSIFIKGVEIPGIVNVKIKTPIESPAPDGVYAIDFTILTKDFEWIDSDIEGVDSYCISQTINYITNPINKKEIIQIRKINKFELIDLEE